ncbi:hypothetical protein H8N00_15180 [Streptomyces sp. AC563]|uniref:hypothetical protein n=1 Tax=Streptomyces buecherae TaxID=2763006 RepID=UPI00164E4691|nr:hypothetical protein [Streptomyces buecherae]MBC3990200.1 hypothetical protein [Streptomyces buecherae]
MRVQPDGDFISLADYLADPANHRPRSNGDAAAAARTKNGADQAVSTGDDEAPSVFDDVTGAVRVMSSRCDTCIGRAGNAAGLTDRRRDALLGRRDDGTYDEGHTVCHSTLPGNSYDLPPAVCAWGAEHPQAAPRSHAMRMAASAGIRYVDPPASGPPKDPAPRAAG